jgi:class 3 adenylate cyclase
MTQGDSGLPTFDIYVRKFERWRLFAQYPHDQKPEAILEAESLDSQPDLEGVRVMTRKSSALKGTVEVLVWMSPRLMARGGQATRRHGGGPLAPSETLMAEMGNEALVPVGTRVAKGANVSSAAALAEASAPAMAPAAAATPKPAGPARRTSKIAGRITVAAVVSGALAGAAALGMVPLSAKLPEYGITLPEQISQGLPFGTFIVVFFGVSGLWTARIIRKARQATAEAEDEAAAVPMPGPDAMAASLPRAAAYVTGAVSSAEGAVETTATPYDEQPSEPEAAPETGDAVGTPGAPGAAAVGESATNPRLILMRFLERILVAIKDVIKKLDAYNSFGLNLFLAGAVERLCEALKLDTARQSGLMVDALSAVGTKPDIAATFGLKMPEYRKDSKYRSMIECGRGAMDGYLADRPDPFDGLPGAFQAWNDPSAAAAVSEGIIVIMFTDMVGSTKLTQDHGDYGAQSVVRAHNAIVRTALANHGGREVKHTGDGIMAVFFTAASAVQATIDIQHDVVKHNEGTDAMPLKVRIGLNAGKVIQEEDDYYGAAVQLSARVCAVAGPDQICVTDSVVSLCQGRDFAFEDRGPHTLKGIDRPVTVYEVLWHEGAMA